MADKDDKAKDGKMEPFAPTAADFIMTPELQEELDKLSSTQRAAVR